jgi:diaminopimelate decarboxylase
MTPFSYRRGQLHCEQVGLADLASAQGTPLYVYSREELLRRAHQYLSTVGPGGLVCFALKANGNPGLIRLLGEIGLGADITSSGELFLARRSGIPPRRIIFSGVGKRESEISGAMVAGIRAIHVESEMEFNVVEQIAARLQLVAPVGVRVNPNISAETHPYISTGLQVHKFGVPPETAMRLLGRARESAWLKPVSLATHLGSQITDLGPFVEAAQFLAGMAAELASAGVKLTYLDVGGGCGIQYDERIPPSIGDWTSAVVAPVREAGLAPVVEPGRSIVGPAGILLTRALYTKRQGDRQFLITDAGMNDLLRPALYGAHHPVLPVAQADSSSPSAVVDVVGPVCESGDWLAKERALPPFAPGQLLALMQAGAYGFAMSSNYNGRLRPAEVLVDGDGYHVIRRRQGLEHLLDGCEPEPGPSSP